MLAPRRVKLGNFTPPERTPWGGNKILTKYKAGLSLNVGRGTKVGESWEVSTEPSFPTVLENGERLADAIARDAVSWLGQEIAEKYDQQNPLLLKLIDPAETLSVQVHPPEDHEMLAPDESGKTEAWIVLEADPAASIYLGFVAGVTAADVERDLTRGLGIEPLLNRIPVHSGDVFVIRPGLVHALGAGVTVVEPQRVRPGRRSVTYRLWDWNRTFDERGEISSTGKRRPLHIRESLAVMDTTGAGTVGSMRTAQSAEWTAEGTSVLIDEPELFVQQCSGSISSRLPARERMLALMCLSGELQVTWEEGALSLTGGETCVVPAILADAQLALTNGRAIAACVQS